MANGIGKGVAIVTLGGITNEFVEYAVDKASKSGVPVGNVTLNASDAVGTVIALAEIGAGAATKKHEVALFGAGGLAISLATIIGKYLMTYNPLNVQAHAAAPASANAQILTVGKIAPGNPAVGGKTAGTQPLANIDIAHPSENRYLIV